MEYGNTPCVGMARKKWPPYVTCTKSYENVMLVCLYEKVLYGLGFIVCRFIVFLMLKMTNVLYRSLSECQ